MPKTFYTDHDIEDLAAKGIKSLVVDDDVVLTDLAREKARRLGVELLREHDAPPSAPERPYIAMQVSPSVSTSQPHPARNKKELQQRIHKAVVERLGDGVDPQLLDTIIRRVLDSVGTN